jgi:hypothetical protein
MTVLQKQLFWNRYLTQRVVKALCVTYLECRAKEQPTTLPTAANVMEVYFYSKNE